MFGYHYTTRHCWEDIQYEGLLLNNIRAHELTDFHNVLPQLPAQAIWTWREEPEGDNAVVVIMSLALGRKSFELVLLEVEYDVKDSSLALHPPEGGTANLTCSFQAGNYDTGSMPISLILQPVPAEQVHCIKEFDLAELTKGHSYA
jgi:hypothetical protein